MKFRLDLATKNRIQSLPNVKFLSFQEFKDIYYDSEGYRITTRDVWLRKRVKLNNPKWEMKVPINFRSRNSTQSIERVRLLRGCLAWRFLIMGLPLVQSQPKMDQYYEMESKLDMSRFLQEEKLVDVRETLFNSLEGLEASGRVRSFAEFETKRTKYEIDNIIIDLDEADFGYSIGELEVLVDSPNEAAAAENRIKALADLLQLNAVGVVRGKLIEFIKRNDPAHYDALRVCGVLRNQ